MTPRRVGLVWILAGAGLALGVQVLAPVGVPLYDGVVVQEPYRYLHPVDGQVGDPTSDAGTHAVVGGLSPVIVANTTENPPQAQLIAQAGAFQLASGTASLTATISPIDPPAVPPDGRISGNVYRFSVTDEAGNPLSPKPCEGCLSLVLRAPEGTAEARVMRFAAGAWAEVETLHAGVVAMYQTNPTALGDYAVVERTGTGPGGPAASSDVLVLVLGGGIALVFAAFIALLFLRARAPRPPALRSAPPGDPGSRPVQGRLPSKRRGPKRPPSGRSEK